VAIERLRQKPAGTYPVKSAYTDDDGTAQTLTGATSVTVRDGAGALVYTGTPTLANGALTADIPAALLPRLDVYTIAWEGTLGAVTAAWESQVELVGGYIFEVADLREQDRAFTAEKYPNETLREVRGWVEDVIEGPRAANVAFVPRSARVTIDGTGRTALLLPNLNLREVYAVTVSGAAWTAGQVAALVIDDGAVWASSVWPEGRRNVTIHYAHGLDHPPGAITRAGLMLAREYLVKSDVPGRATATSIGDQLFRLTVAGRDGVTGLPDVDAAIDQFGRKTYTVG